MEKSKLPLRNGVGIIVLNKDDKYYKFFCEKSKLRNIKIMSFSIKNKKSNVFFFKPKKNK